VIDDDESVRLVVRATLEAAGHHVREASDGRKGLEVFRNDPADVAITDIVMPERDGLEVIMHLRRYSPKVRIFAMS